MSDHAVTAGTELTATGMPDAAHMELAAAAAQLRQGNGVLVRFADLVGTAMGRSVRVGARSVGLPAGTQEKVKGLATAALARAFDLAVIRLDSSLERARKNEMTRAVVVASGAVGGFLGLGGFLPDVTVTTFAIMRSIARIAQEEGENIAHDDTRRACLEVFGLVPGEKSKVDSDVGYYSARLIMQGRPLMMLATEVASRYGISISQKLALQAVPFVGALGGAALNAAFLRHYQDVARAHFVIRRLEREYGPVAVSHAWTELHA